MSSSLGNKEVMAENLKRYMDMYGEDRKTIVNNLISKVDVTADNIDIIFKFQLA